MFALAVYNIYKVAIVPKHNCLFQRALLGAYQEKHCKIVAFQGTVVAIYGFWHYLPEQVQGTKSLARLFGLWVGKYEADRYVL